MAVNEEVVLTPISCDRHMKRGAMNNKETVSTLTAGIAANLLLELQEIT